MTLRAALAADFETLAAVLRLAPVWLRHARRRSAVYRWSYGQLPRALRRRLELRTLRKLAASTARTAADAPPATRELAESIAADMAAAVELAAAEHAAAVLAGARHSGYRQRARRALYRSRRPR
jgi:hypothetical protein